MNCLYSYNMSLNKRGRKKQKEGRYCTFYLANDVIAAIIKRGRFNKSSYIEQVVRKDWREFNSPETIKREIEEAGL